MTHEVRMPVLSQSMIQGRVVEWLLKEGDPVVKGAPLVVVESDKATHELEAPQAGILRKILVEAGAEVDVETPIAVLAEADEPLDTQAAVNSPQASPAAPSLPASAPGAGRRKPVSPVAKRVAHELGVDPAQVTGQ